jgi:hypothetical protein
MTNKLEYLKEAYNYKGVNFVENYLATKFLKAFVEDALVFGIDEAKELYIELFGEDTKPILEAMTQDGFFLSEASKVNTELLFEETGAEKVKQYLREEPTITDVSMIPPAQMQQQTLSNIGKNLLTSPALPIVPGSAQDTAKNLLSLGAVSNATTSIGAKAGILGFLQKIWQTIKGFGSGLISKLQTFLTANFPGAAKFLAKPLKFLATNPIAQVAVPALLITGGVVLAVKLLNRLRGKVGGKTLSRREMQELEAQYAQNRSRIEELKGTLASSKQGFA